MGPSGEAEGRTSVCSAGGEDQGKWGGGGGGGGRKVGTGNQYALLGGALANVAACFHCRRGFQCIAPPLDQILPR